MFNKRNLARAAGLAFAGACATYMGAQVAKVAVDPKDTKQFPYKEAADPSKVIESFVSGSNLGVSEAAPDNLQDAAQLANGNKKKGNNGTGQGGGKIPLGTHDPAFSAMEMLGRPTDTAITVNAEPRKDVEVFYEYGTKPGTYTGRTEILKHPANNPFNVLIDQLKPNTQYYYRMRFREGTTGEFQARNEYSFHTQRAPGSTFKFVLQFDPHLAGANVAEPYQLTLKKMAADHADFMLDLGDNFQIDRLKPVTKAGVDDRVKLLRSYYDIVNHSTPLFMALGNHEGEWGQRLDGTPNNMAVLDTIARKLYIPNPEPNKFYTGGNIPEQFVGLRQSYYSFVWGDAQFFILDPYWYRPANGEMDGDWWTTLGKEQYTWFRRELEASKSTYKFVFSHNLIGGLDMHGKMRGGIETVKYTEMGGYNYDGTYGFDKARPGWGVPLHPLLVANNATAWFHGHDHLYVHQELNGVTYQEGPMPARSGLFDAAPTSKEYNYLHGTVVNGSGYIRVTVGPEEVKVEFVQTYLPNEEDAAHKDGMVADSYTIKAKKNLAKR